MALVTEQSNNMFKYFGSPNKDFIDSALLIQSPEVKKTENNTEVIVPEAILSLLARKKLLIFQALIQKFQLGSHRFGL